MKPLSSSSLSMLFPRSLISLFLVAGICAVASLPSSASAFVVSTTNTGGSENRQRWPDTDLRTTSTIPSGWTTRNMPFSSSILLSSSSSGSSTPEYPLYDGTNYTFPDTTTASGIAEVLECAFVQACMQLSSGEIDVLKLFIATCLTSYSRLGLTLDEIQTALAGCLQQTANRELMDEELELRTTWVCIVYMTLQAMNDSGDSRKNKNDGSSSATSIMTVPAGIRGTYGAIIDRIAGTDPNNASSVSVEELMKEYYDPTTTKSGNAAAMDRAIASQSVRVALLTPVVVREALEAGYGNSNDKQKQTSSSSDAMPLTPPIEGAF